jgi:septal ring-binding cell division protein DamX
VSAVETPPTPPPAEEAAPRQCPRCGAPLEPEQEWCLSCGTGVGATVASPRGWRWPLAVVAALLALALAAFVLALVELAGNAEQVGPQAAATPAPTAGAPAATPSPTPASTTIAPAGGASAIGDWPAGKTGYTVVLESSSTRSAADARATELAGQGIPAGVLDSSGYATLTPNRFVVFSGQYDTRAAARQALAGLKSRVQGAKVARVAPA